MEALDPALPRPPSIVHALAAAASECPQQEALVCGQRRVSYAALAQGVASLARALSHQDLAGQRVVIAMPSGIEAVLAVLAVMAVRGQAVLINPFFSAAELRTALAEADPRAIVWGPEAADKLRPLAEERSVPWRGSFGQAVEGEARLDLDLLLSDRGPALDLSAAPGPDDEALLIFTGGTTGVPKAVVHRHHALNLSLLQHCSVWRVERRQERFLSAAPIFHIWGLLYAAFVPLYCAGTLVIVPKYDPGLVLAAIERERITVFGGGPAPIYMGLTRHPAYATTDFSSLKYCLTGGAPCPAALTQQWESHTGCPLLEGWGMSEAAPLCLNRPDEERKPLSVGRAVPETEVEIVDLETGLRAIDVGGPGEVRVRGPQVMVGYRGHADETNATLRDGWLYTGDIGTLDDTGHLFLVDRKKDLVIVGGYNVYPRHVDEVLYQHPKVSEAACVGRLDDHLGEVLVAFVVPNQGQSLDEDELADFCRKNLVKYRRPVAFYFLEALPRTGARKLDRKRLHAQAAATRLTNPPDEPA